VDGDLLQLVALVEPPELAVGEGVADGDRSHGCAGAGRCRRGAGRRVRRGLDCGQWWTGRWADGLTPGVFVGGRRGSGRPPG
jgi:hypothetical protein